MKYLITVVLFFYLDCCFSQDTYLINNGIIKNKDFFGCYFNPFKKFGLKDEKKVLSSQNYDSNQLIRRLFGVCQIDLNNCVTIKLSGDDNFYYVYEFLIEEIKSNGTLKKNIISKRKKDINIKGFSCESPLGNYEFEIDEKELNIYFIEDKTDLKYIILRFSLFKNLE